MIAATIMWCNYRARFYAYAGFWCQILRQRCPPGAILGREKTRSAGDIPQSFAVALPVRLDNC
jgi:hypothetical protein